jgi:hypothetical protein
LRLRQQAHEVSAAVVSAAVASVVSVGSGDQIAGKLHQSWYLSYSSYSPKWFSSSISMYLAFACVRICSSSASPTDLAPSLKAVLSLSPGNVTEPAYMTCTIDQPVQEASPTRLLEDVIQIALAIGIFLLRFGDLCRI